MRYLFGAGIFAAVASLGTAQVVINEFQYDDSGTDTHEFVELYNKGVAPVDISGWTVEGIDTAPTADSIATIPAATSIAAGGFYVLGMTAVTPKNQDIEALGDYQNDQEALTLKNGSTIIDSVVYERNKANVVIPVGLGEPAFDGVTTASGGGIWGNFIMNESALTNGNGFDFDGIPNGSFSLARHTNGQDTNNNDRDFGLQIATPGASNNGNGTINLGALPYVNNFTAADGTSETAFQGGFNPGVVQDPAVVDIIGGTAGAANPNAIPASPQGGNVLVYWDSSGGGNNGPVNLNGAIQDVEVEMYVYTPSALTTTNTEEATYIVVRGKGDPVGSYNLEPANGDSGIRWRYLNNVAVSGVVELRLEQRDNGVITQIGSAVPVTAGWHRLFLRVQGSAVRGIVDGTYGTDNTGTIINGTTTVVQAGGMGIGYREAVIVNSNCRPPTIDAFTIRVPSVAAVENWGIY